MLISLPLHVNANSVCARHAAFNAPCWHLTGLFELAYVCSCVFHMLPYTMQAVSAWLSTVDLAFKGQCVKIELPWSDATPHHVALVPYMYFGSPVPESRAGSVIELTR